MAEEYRILYPVIQQTKNTCIKDAGKYEDAFNRAGYNDHNDWYNKDPDPKPVFIRPSALTRSGGIKIFRSYKSELYVNAVVTNDYSVFISIDYGKIEAYGMNPGSVKGWPKSILAASLSNFWLGSTPNKANILTISDRTGSSTNYETKTFSRPADLPVGTSLHSKQGIYVFYSNFGMRCEEKKGKTPNSYAVSGGNWTNYNDTPKGTRGFPLAKYSSNEEWLTDEWSTKNKHRYVRVPETGLVLDGISNFSELRKYMSNNGYTYIGNISSFGTSTPRIYISGICLFNVTSPGDYQWSYAKSVPITGLKVFQNYYPWQRKPEEVPDEWLSLNRKGTQSGGGEFEHSWTL